MGRKEMMMAKSEKLIWRIVFHTPEERNNFEEVKNTVLIVIGKEMTRIFEPQDNGKKAIFFAATNAQKKKIENLLQNAGIKVTISSPLAPC